MAATALTDSFKQLNTTSGVVRSTHSSIAAADVLRSPPAALLGVTAIAASALAKLNLNTVFDLATSSIFDAAKKLTAASEDTTSLIYRYGTPSSDLIRASRAVSLPLTELQNAPLVLLAGIPEVDAESIQIALDVTTIRDLSLYPPYLAAVALLNHVYFPENTVGYDAEAPADLLPRSGEYPVEKVRYTSLVMGEINETPGVVPQAPLIDIQGTSFSPLDLNKLAAAQDVGFKTVAFGALLSFTQSWFAQGVTLGHLLHSATLAPGESTRIAVIDWSRKTNARGDQIGSQDDSITNTTDNKRAISEVTSAVAEQAQSGFSAADSQSSATQKAAAVSLSGGASSPFYSVELNASASIAQQNANASSASYSTSAGRTDVGSDMLQNVNDQTHQAAHSSRNMRASVVKEVSEDEHEQVSTRILTNYNHSHAMTIQYYEVVQIFRVEVNLAHVDKVVFIPVMIPNFDDENIIRRFQTSLARAALGPGILDALMTLDLVELAPETDNINWASIGGLKLRDFRSRLQVAAKSNLFTGEQHLMIIRSNRDEDGNIPPLGAPREPEQEEPEEEAPPTRTPVLAPPKEPVLIQFPITPQRTVVRTINSTLWVDSQIRQLSALLSTNLLKTESNSLWLPADLLIMGWSAATTPDKIDAKLVVTNTGGAVVTTIDEEHPFAIRDIKSIGVTGSSPDKDIDVTITLTLDRNGVRFPLSLPTVKITKGFGAETRFLFGKTGGVNTNIKQHLNTNRMHYTQAIYKGFDAMQIAYMLAGYGYMMDGKLVPLAQVVEPRPIQYVGNYLVFKTNVSPDHDSAWKEFLANKAIKVNSKKEDLVPIGSGGTFAEAILGRSNCSEKLDMTRFWNWQDSPIPILPTEIAPIQTGSRATPEDTTAQPMGAPIINMSTPTNLPDPTGTANVLAAVQNGNLFRDMSGLQATIAANQAALQASSAGANAAQAAALQAGVETAKVGVDRQKVAASTVTDLVKTAASLELGKQTKPSSHSEEGAKANFLDKATAKARQDATKAVANRNKQRLPPLPNPDVGGAPGGTGGAGTGSRNQTDPPNVIIDDSNTPFGSGTDTTRALMRQNPSMQLVSGRPQVMDLIDEAVDSLGPVGNVLRSAVETVGGGLTTAFGEALSPKNEGFVHLQGDIGIVPRLQEIARDPSKFAQANYNSCQAALFYYHIASIHPFDYVECGKTLLARGQGTLGGLRFEPEDVIKKQNYYGLAQADQTNGTYPHPADWMMIVSVTNNLSFRDLVYETFKPDSAQPGSPNDRRMHRHIDYLLDLYRETGYYSSVVAVDRPTEDWVNPNHDPNNKDDDDPKAAGTEWKQKVLDTVGPGSPGRFGIDTQIGLWIDMSFLNDRRKGTHVIALNSKLALEPDGPDGKKFVSFKAWTWGAVKDYNMPLDSFATYLYAIWVFTVAKPR